MCQLRNNVVYTVLDQKVYFLYLLLFTWVQSSICITFPLPLKLAGVSEMGLWCLGDHMGRRMETCSGKRELAEIPCLLCKWRSNSCKIGVRRFWSILFILTHSRVFEIISHMVKVSYGLWHCFSVCSSQKQQCASVPKDMRQEDLHRTLFLEPNHVQDEKILSTALLKQAKKILATHST